jgi:radical SAM protein with 4Fe4S-binding SPASM domain
MFDWDCVPQRISACSFRVYSESGFMVLINHLTDDYLVFEGVAADIWQSIDGVASLRGISDRLATTYEVDRELLESDLQAFMQSLHDFGLLSGHQQALPMASPSAVAGREESEAEDAIRDWALAECVPYEGMFELTNRCNERCIHCYLDGAPARGELSLAEIRRVLDELADLGCLRLTFTGGEIFTHPHLYEILSYAREAHHFYVTLLTNGTRIDQPRADDLASLGVRSVGISVYSACPDEHDRVTRRPGSHVRTLRGIAALRDAGVDVTINCPVTKPTQQVASGIIRLAAELGVHYSFDPYLIPTRDGTGSAHPLALSRAELVKVLREISQESGEPLSTFSRIEQYTCNAGQSTFCIGPTGEVYPCLDMRISAGNCRRLPLGDIWRRGSILREFRTGPERRLVDCQPCALRSYCKRCFARAYHDDGHFYGCSSQARLRAEIAATFDGSS